MSKFKPFHEFQKPLVGISHEAYLDYIETVIPEDHLCRLVKRGSTFIKYRGNRSAVFIIMDKRRIIRS